MHHREGRCSQPTQHTNTHNQHTHTHTHAHKPVLSCRVTAAKGSRDPITGKLEKREREDTTPDDAPGARVVASACRICTRAGRLSAPLLLVYAPPLNSDACPVCLSAHKHTHTHTHSHTHTPVLFYPEHCRKTVTCPPIRGADRHGVGR